MTTEQRSQLEGEIESWRGFSYVMREEDRELWDRMIREVRERFGNAVENSGKTFATEPFFMSLLLAQQEAMKSLLSELRERKESLTATEFRMPR